METLERKYPKGCGEPWMGKRWVDMPGCDEVAKKMVFFLFKRGMHSGRSDEAIIRRARIAKQHDLVSRAKKAAGMT